MALKGFKAHPTYKKVQWGVSAGIVIGVLCAIASHFGALDIIEHKFYDLRQRWSSSADSASPDIVTLLIDNQSLTAMQNQAQDPWIWEHDKYGEVVDYLKAQGAQAVLFDMLYLSVEDIYRPDWRQVPINQKLPRQPNWRFARALDAFGHGHSGVVLSRAGADTVAEIDKAVAAMEAAKDRPEQIDFLKAQQRDFLAAQQLAGEKHRIAILTPGEKPPAGRFGIVFERELTLPVYKDFEPPYRELTETLRGLGSLQVDNDADGITRRVVLFVRVEPGGDESPYLMPTAPFGVLLDLWRPESLTVTARPELVLAFPESAKRAEVRVPLDANGAMLLRYHGTLIPEQAKLRAWREAPRYQEVKNLPYMEMRAKTPAEIRSVYAPISFFTTFQDARAYNLAADSLESAEAQMAVAQADLDAMQSVETYGAMQQGKLDDIQRRLGLVEEGGMEFATLENRLHIEKALAEALSQITTFQNRAQWSPGVPEAPELTPEVFTDRDRIAQQLRAVWERCKAEGSRDATAADELPREVLAKEKADLERAVASLKRYIDPDEAMRARIEKLLERDRPKKQPMVEEKRAAVAAARAALEEKKKTLATWGLFEKKIVVLGTSATGLLDLKPTPFSKHDPGLVIHATTLDNFLQADTIGFLQRAKPYLGWIVALFVCMASAALATALPRVWMSFLAIVAFVAGYWWLNLKLFEGNLVFDVATPTIGAVLAFAGGNMIAYLTEGRDKRKVRGMLDRYVSPSVAATVMTDPEKAQLGGDRKEMTVYFSDLAGFTTLSEMLPAEELVEILNEYLGRMTDTIMNTHLGTLDKYIGDAVMAFWNAPLPQPDHAKRCCFAALDNFRLLCIWREQLMEEGGHPRLDQRIGVNTGSMVVGNTGSETRQNYTVLGDPVNLAARLEAANKSYGTNLMIGQNTVDAAREWLIVRELDTIAVKGKKQGVQVYELLAKILEEKQGKEMVKVPELTGEHLRWVKRYEEGLDFYRKMRFDEAIVCFEQAIKQRAETSFPPKLCIAQEEKAAPVMIERCRAMVEDPPVPKGESWDGIYRMTTK